MLYSANTKPSTQRPPARVTLTHDGQNHNHEVKNVPPDGEIIVPQSEHLQHTLTGEEDDKHQVDPVKDVLHLLALCVCLHHHGDHVEANEHHDDYVKCLLSNKVKDSSLNAVLCNGREARNKVSQQRIHGGNKDEDMEFLASDEAFKANSSHNSICLWERQENPIIYTPNMLPQPYESSFLLGPKAG